MTRARTAKACGLGALVAGANLRVEEPGGDGDTKAGLTGASTQEPVNTIAQGRPGAPVEPVVTKLVCFFHLHTRLWVRPAPGFPCALCLSGGTAFFQNSGRSSRENERLRHRCELLSLPLNAVAIGYNY